MDVAQLLQLINSHFPLHLALDWDNCGLQVGNPHQKIDRVLISLDISIQTVEEALNKGCNTIISHHPLLFRGIKRIDTTSPLGAIIEKALTHKIAILSFHTNVDVAEDGLADKLATLLDLTPEAPLEEGGLGRVCSCKPVSIQNFIDLVCERLEVEKSELRIVEGNSEVITKVALCPGSGGDLIPKAIQNSAQCYITGDVKYHQAQEALGKIWVIDAGHYHTEKIFCRLIKEVLEKHGVACEISRLQTNPFTYMGGGNE